jgi:hypothetical protein
VNIADRVSERAASRKASIVELNVLEDGSYDALVVDASTDGGAIALDLTILSGAHKGEVVAVRAEGMVADELELLGMPGTLFVENGVPRFVVER